MHDACVGQRNLARRGRQPAIRRVVHEHVQHGDRNETLTLEHDCLVIEHRQLDVDLERLLLPDQARRIPGERHAAQLRKQVEKLLIQCNGSRDLPVVGVRHPSLVQEVDLSRTQIPPCGSGFSLRRPSAQSSLTEQRERLGDPYPIRPVNIGASEASGCGHDVEHRIFQ